MKLSDLRLLLACLPRRVVVEMFALIEESNSRESCRVA
jgi:hypothetical protein